MYDMTVGCEDSTHPATENWPTNLSDGRFCCTSEGVSYRRDGTGLPSSVATDECADAGRHSVPPTAQESTEDHN